MTRSYIRISPDLAEEKERDGYSEAAVGAFVRLFCEAEKQSRRGNFKSLAILRAHLGRSARWVSFFLAQNDLELLADKSYRVVGWDEWQEGNWQVAERMKRVRESKSKRNADRNGESNGDRNATHEAVTPPGVTPPSRVEAVSGKRLAKASDVTPPAPVMDEDAPPFPLRSPDAIKNYGYDDATTELAKGMIEVLGRMISPVEITECQGALNQYAYLSGPELVARAIEHQEYCKDHDLPRARTVGGFADSWRRENDHRSDAGKPKAARVQLGRGKGDMTHIGEIAKGLQP